MTVGGPKMSPVKLYKKWVAQIKVDGKPKHLGTFGFQSDAAICWNYHAAYLFGEFAKLNKIGEYFHD